MNDAPMILPLNRIPEVGEFLNAFGVKPKGLGAQLITHVYEDIFVRSTELRAQYERYYLIEYEKFERYLELAHDIELSADDLEKKFILKIDSTGGVVDQAYDDNIFDIAVDVIRKMERSNEDKN